MKLPKTVEIKEFAKRVEHVCDFFLSRTDADGSGDRRVLEDLKNDAADIQFDQGILEKGPFVGLDDYMRGIKNAPEENIGRES